MDELLLNYFIVNYGTGSKILNYSKSIGLEGGTIFQAYGTINNSLLRLLSFNENKKDVVIIIEFLKNNQSKLKDICAHFQFNKQNYGIGFNVKINDLFKQTNRVKGTEGTINMNEKELIIAIVQKGQGEAIVEAAQKVTKTGATIINARGAGIHETSKIFAIEIEPEKEIVLILIDKHLKDKICQSIQSETEIAHPGKGLLFTQSINEVYGLYESVN